MHKDHHFVKFHQHASNIPEMFLCILLACLQDWFSICWRSDKRGKILGLTLAGFPTFCPMTFHLFASYSLIASRSATDCMISRIGLEPHVVHKRHGWYYLVFCKLGIMHILPSGISGRQPSVWGVCFSSHLIPMLLDATFRPSRECLQLICEWSHRASSR